MFLSSSVTLVTIQDISDDTKSSCHFRQERTVPKGNLRGRIQKVPCILTIYRIPNRKYGTCVFIQIY